ncbi:MAG: hypothetical protein Q4D43_01345 [Clostridia bacterium]|nr:hypothetical protein [Clostridia bacterium]
MRSEQEAVHLEVLSAIRGRIRLQLERSISSIQPLQRLEGIRSCRYNPRINTLLCEYDPATISEDALLVRIGAIYAAQTNARLLHIRHSEEAGFSMAPSGGLALLCIGLDGALSLAGSSLTMFSRWLSTGATLAAVVEHGYQELHVRGSFDPEVMSVVYLINSVGKPGAVRASLLAWIITFGRHLIPRAPREQPYLVRRSGRQVTLTPMVGSESELAFAGSMFRRGMEMMVHKA